MSKPDETTGSNSTAPPPAGEFAPVITGFSAGAAPAGQSVSDIQVGLKNATISDLAGNGEGEDDENDNLPKSVINRLIALKNLQDESQTIESQYKLERVQLEKKFRELKAPQMEKRYQIIHGLVEVESLVPEPEVVVENEEEEKVVGIPGFWLQCLQNHPNVGDLITDEDVTALESLKDIKCEYNDDMSGFKLIFEFAENEYFTNKELSKSYTVSPDLLDEKAPALTNVEGSTIEWKPSKNLCVSEVRKKQRAKSGRRAGQVRYVTSLADKPSFFHYFKEPNMTEDEDEEEEEEEEEGARKKSKSKYTLGIDEDYEIGHAIRTAIIPEAVLWFTGEAAGEDDEFEDDEEDDDDDDDDYEDEDGDDEPDAEAEDEAPKKPKGKKGWKGAGGPGVPAAGQGEQPECKQN